MKSSTLVCAVASALVIHAVSAIEFPAATGWSGNTDLGSEDAWGGAFPTVSVTFRALDTNPLVLTLSQDLTLPLGGNGTVFYSNPGKGKITFDFSADNKTMTSLGQLAFGSTGADFEFKGGKWDVKDKIMFGLNWWGDRTGTTVTLNGVEMQTAGRIDGVMTGSDNRIVLTNSASLAMVGTTAYDFRPTQGSVDSSFEVLDGSRLTFPTAFKQDAGSGGTVTDYKSLFRVAGRGTRVEQTKDSGAGILFGNESSHNLAIIEDGAWMRGYLIEVGHTAEADWNGVIIRNGGILTNHYSAAIGAVAGADHNYVHVLDGSEFRLGDDSRYASLDINGSFNELLVSNGTVAAYLITVGGVEGNRFTLMGPEAKVYYYSSRTGQKPFFGTGHHHVFTLDAGAVYDYAGADVVWRNLNEADQGASNVVRVLNGSRFVTPKNVQIGSAYVASRGHALSVEGMNSMFSCNQLNLRSDGGSVVVADGAELSCNLLRAIGDESSLFVGDGAKLTATNFLMSATDGLFAVSNGTVVLGNQTGMLQSLTNCTLAIKGRSPYLGCGDTGGGVMLEMYGDASLRFDVSEGVYDHAPLDLLQLRHDEALDIEIEGIEALQKQLTHSVNVHLVHTTCDSGLLWLRWNPDVLERANAKLPQGCYFTRKLVTGTDAHEDLYVHIKSNAGMSIIIR